MNYRQGEKVKHLTVKMLGMADLDHVIDFRCWSSQFVNFLRLSGASRDVRRV
jgi:hypothetical protein